MTIARDYGSTEQVLKDAIDAAGGAKEAAFLLGLKNEYAIYPMIDPSKRETMSFNRVRQLALARDGFARRIAEDAAQLAGGTFSPLTGAAPLRGLVAQSAKDWGEYSAHLIEALADGRIDTAEARQLLPELDALIMLLAEQRVAIAEAVDAGGPA